ncbi:hypothetical protein [Scleromatobacter humisilvae]|uniref:Uncharacterized protein n=1 Tax=Scleromatobacter humisilvae TaxID=2897159 RepID=A0A9X2C2J1_9BURK|nr:hypothetical protein [Scleromatobacter humisilvae]MCK9689417.1 hypothetical protein [Scleromatobacter humisilvae]
MCKLPNNDETLLSMERLIIEPDDLPASHGDRHLNSQGFVAGLPGWELFAVSADTRPNSDLRSRYGSGFVVPWGRREVGPPRFMRRRKSKFSEACSLLLIGPDTSSD